MTKLESSDEAQSASARTGKEKEDAMVVTSQADMKIYINTLTIMAAYSQTVG